ncbi:hypothetical protein [Caldimonas sp. KR1-144]|uniref:hypothetical protein n=1 Tax=Caldimonas sp. KR1-144 TaxID=3400911 RepID=UPI003C07572A
MDLLAAPATTGTVHGTIGTFMFAKLFASIFALAYATFAIASDASGDPNCSLETPPADAGEIFHFFGGANVLGRVYPRLSAMPASYTGCQVLWSSIDGRPVVRTTTFIRGGRVVSSIPEPDVPFCLPGEQPIDTGCRSRKGAFLVSYPPGCAARFIETRTVPQDCLRAFLDEYKLHDGIEEQ